VGEIAANSFLKANTENVKRVAWLDTVLATTPASPPPAVFVAPRRSRTWADNFSLTPTIGDERSFRAHLNSRPFGLVVAISYCVYVVIDSLDRIVS
jgi:hypothetical protein